jgi:hypothetical protein
LRESPVIKNVICQQLVLERNSILRFYIHFLIDKNMKNKLLSRRTFVKTTSLGVTGSALSIGGLSAIYLAELQDADKLAILGGTPVRRAGTNLEVSWPIFDDTDINMYLDAFKSKKWSEYNYSPQELSFRFKKEFAKMMGVGFCAPTNSGTDALDAAQRALDIGPGD